MAGSATSIPAAHGRTSMPAPAAPVVAHGLEHFFRRFDSPPRRPRKERVQSRLRWFDALTQAFGVIIGEFHPRLPRLKGPRLLHVASLEGESGAERSRRSAAQRSPRGISYRGGLRRGRSCRPRLACVPNTGGRDRLGQETGHSPLVARVRHLNDKDNPDHWRAA